MNKKRFYIFISTFALIALFFGLIQYIGVFDTLYVAASNPGHSWNQMECSSTLCVDTFNKRVGIGTDTPQSKLDVNGSLKLNGDPSDDCNSLNEGTINYFLGNFYFCNGNRWQDFTKGCGSEITDSRDNNRYSTVQIGDQCWMAENLRYLPSVNSTTTDYSTRSTDSKYYVYGNLGSDVEVAKLSSGYNYGVYYNYNAAQAACPPGWELPTHDDWTTLERAVCTSSTCATDFPYNNTTTGWLGTNEGSVLKEIGVGLNMNMSGWLYSNYYVISELNSVSAFWSSSGWMRIFRVERSNAFRMSYNNTSSGLDAGSGLSVRCIKKKTI